MSSVHTFTSEGTSSLLYAFCLARMHVFTVNLAHSVLYINDNVDFMSVFVVVNLQI